MLLIMIIVNGCRCERMLKSRRGGIRGGSFRFLWLRLSLVGLLLGQVLIVRITRIVFSFLDIS